MSVHLVSAVLVATGSRIPAQRGGGLSVRGATAVGLQLCMAVAAVRGACALRARERAA
jgi:hypothetical protein